jgi:hypothetical protein
MYARLPRILLLCLLPVYAIYLFAPSIGYMHDDGVYMVTARALAKGHGYLIESLPNNLPQTKYPILYPAVLSVLWKWIPDTDTAVLASKVFSLVCCGVWLWLVTRYVRRQFTDQLTADWILFFTAAAPWVVFLSASALPDMLFAVCSTAAILLLLKATGGDGSRVTPLVTAGIVAAAGALAAAGFLLRSAGIALIAAGIVILVRRSWKHAALFAGTCFLLCLPWLLWQASQPAPVDPVQLYYSKSSYARGHIFAGYGLTQMFMIATMNLLMLANSYGSSLQSLPVTTSFIGGLLLLGITAVGWFRAGRSSRWDAVSIWVLFYTGLLICWAWPPYRYATLVLPFYLVYLAKRLQEHEWTVERPKVARGILATLGVVALATTILGARTTLQTGTPTGWGTADRWPESRELAEWIKANTPADAVVSGNLDPTLYLVGERKAIRVFYHMPYDLFYGLNEEAASSGSTEDIRRHFQHNRISYVVLTPMNGFKEGESFLKVFEQLRAQKPGAFRLVKQLPTPGYSIYQVDSQAL